MIELIKNRNYIYYERRTKPLLVKYLGRGHENRKLIFVVISDTKKKIRALSEDTVRRKVKYRNGV